MADVLLTFAQSGISGVIVLIVYWLHRDAVNAHDQRAADWRAAYEREAARANEREDQLRHVLSAVHVGEVAT